MRRRALALLLIQVCFCVAADGQDNPILATLSPKLRQFLASHRDARQILNVCLNAASSGRTIKAYYFYTDDESIPRAYHFYPSEGAVVIAVRENQEPTDEFISLLYEAVNSLSEKTFESLADRAAARKIPKEEFAREVCKVEFSNEKRVRDLLRGVKLRGGEVRKSHYFKTLENMPDDFDAYLSYISKIVPYRNGIREYEEQYETLQTAQPGGETTK
jgi:hypothetical protein